VSTRILQMFSGEQSVRLIILQFNHILFAHVLVQYISVTCVLSEKKTREFVTKYIGSANKISLNVFLI